MAKITPVRLKTFTYDEFNVIKETLKEWNYEWLEYDLLYDNESEFVDVAFYLEEGVISLDEFIHLFFDLGYEGVYKGR